MFLQTVHALEAFLVAMALFPRVQKKAQAELDQVVGPDRLPTFEDIRQIPYIEAVILETLRWVPVTPIGVPHVITGHDEYRGYDIPKGSIIISVSLHSHVY